MLPMFGPGGDSKRRAIQLAVKHIRENPETIHKIYSHNDEEGRAKYGTDVEGFEDSFPQGFPNSKNPQMGQEYFVRFLALHLNRPYWYFDHPPPMELQCLKDAVADVIHKMEKDNEGGPNIYKDGHNGKVTVGDRHAILSPDDLEEGDGEEPKQAKALSRAHRLPVKVMRKSRSSSSQKSVSSIDSDGSDYENPAPKSRRPRTSRRNPLSRTSAPSKRIRSAAAPMAAAPVPTVPQTIPAAISTQDCQGCRGRRKYCNKVLPQCAGCVARGKPCKYGGTVKQARTAHKLEVQAKRKARLAKLRGE